MSKTPILDYCHTLQYEYRREHTRGRSRGLAWLVDYSALSRIRAEADWYVVRKAALFEYPYEQGRQYLFGYPLYDAPQTFGEEGEHIRFLPEAEIREKLEIMGWL